MKSQHAERTRAEARELSLHRVRVRGHLRRRLLALLLGGIESRDASLVAGPPVLLLRAMTTDRSARASHAVASPVKGEPRQF